MGDLFGRAGGQDGLLDGQQAQQALGVAALRLLGLLLVGDIAGDLGEAAQRAGPVSESGDHDVGEEAGAVVAQAPALVLDAALGRRLLRLPRGLPRATSSRQKQQKCRPMISSAR